MLENCNFALHPLDKHAISSMEFSFIFSTFTKQEHAMKEQELLFSIESALDIHPLENLKSSLTILTQINLIQPILQEENLSHSKAF